MELKRPDRINPPARSPVGQWTAADFPDRGRRGMRWGAAPTGGLLPGQGALSNQEGRGCVRMASPNSPV